MSLVSSLPTKTVSKCCRIYLSEEVKTRVSFRFVKILLHSKSFYERRFSGDSRMCDLPRLRT
jgi:hypothetical protein